MIALFVSPASGTYSSTFFPLFRRIVPDRSPSRRRPASASGHPERTSPHHGVPPHLVDERARVREALLVTQSGHELDPELNPVQIAVKVEQMDLHQDVGRVVEGGASADADEGRVTG